MEPAADNPAPRGNRTHIAFFGLRNAGKSTLVNAFTNSPIAIVSDVPGTTTDPVSKAMEILPLGPCTITDTAGLDDDAGELGALRVKKTLDVLKTADIAVWVGEGFERWREKFNIPVVQYRRGESVDELKRKIAAMKSGEGRMKVLDGLVEAGALVLCVCPIDESAPKGRLILPQQQVLRECLDAHAAAIVCQPQEVAAVCAKTQVDLAITDSQAFGEVRRALPPHVKLTSFSILFARAKGDLESYLAGLEAVGKLRDGDLVVIAEGCVHHRQCNDIGTVKIPKALERLAECKLSFRFLSGNAFNEDELDGAALMVQCGGCMLTRRETMARIAAAKEKGVPVVNYGMLLAKAQGVDVEGAMP
ncbi:MAG: 50S ribosome-binding GTPase [Kiritimatiellae bacterium]|nr:50S ribosome-binding GTPase [Kiritimatiellia bacterium]